jgi:hypothetical protein
MESNIQASIEVDTSMLKRMATRILEEEHKNLTTKKYSSAHMVEMILKIIRHEVEKNEN